MDQYGLNYLTMYPNTVADNALNPAIGNPAIGNPAIDRITRITDVSLSKAGEAFGEGINDGCS